MDPFIIHQDETKSKEFYTEEKCYISELSNGNGDAEMSIARARVEPGVTTAWHRLKTTTERYHIISGKGRVEVGSLPPEEVSSGDTVFIPPMCAQRITNIGEDDLIFLAICTPPFSEEDYEDMEGAGSEQLVKISLKELEEAFFYLDSMSSAYIEADVVIDKKTGEFLYSPNEEDADSPESLEFDEWSEMHSGDNYVSLPDKWQLDLGKRLVFDFVKKAIPEHWDRVSNIFNKRGAYRRYKAFLDDIDKLEEWYEFEVHTRKRALQNWAKENGFFAV